MATDLQPRKSPSKAEAFVERTLADLCARVRRSDVVACLLTTTLAILSYALFIALFDRAVGNTSWLPVLRWSLYGTAHALFLALLLRTMRCALRPINPYYIAQQLEQSLSAGNNSLINWLDLHDEELPTAFRRNLSANAAEQLKDSDLDRPIASNKNWLLLVAHSVLMVGLVFLLALGPGAFLASMQRAFLPFLDMSEARTRIMLVQPADGDVDITANQPVRIVARIEGRIPASHRADAPQLLYRYQPTEDFIAVPLTAEDGLFTTQLPSAQLRGGLTYKITAGDAATPEYRIRVRARAHVRTFDITYHPRPYRKLDRLTTTFPNSHATHPTIHGMRGTEVEMTVRTSRPFATARVEIADDGTRSLPITKQAADRFSCRLTLDKPGGFRIAFTAIDGEESIDRDWHDILVAEDEAPRVVLTSPARDVALPVNGTLELEGRASDDVGIRQLALHMRVIQGETLQPKLYRAGQLGAEVIEYQDFIALDQLKSARGIPHDPGAGAVLEYWLEATDNADYPASNVSKSEVYKVTLLPRGDETKQKAARERAEAAQRQREKKQDQRKEKSSPKDGGGSLEQQASDLRNDKQDQETRNKIDQALKDQQDNGSGGGHGEAKGSPPQPGEGGTSKDQQPMSPADAGQGKEGNPSDSGEARDQGPSGNEPGDSKPGPMGKAEPSTATDTTSPPESGAKQTGSDDMPPMPLSREPASDQPEPKAKGDGATQPGGAKGASPKGSEPTLDELAQLLEKLPQPGAEGDAAAEKLKEIAQKSGDAPVRDLAAEILTKNGRDPATGKQTKKLPNPYGSLGVSAGISDDIKAAAANREFARRISALQLDSWKKRVTADLLKKAGVSPAAWERYVRNHQAHDALLRQLNARQTMAQIRATRPAPGLAPTLIETTMPRSDDPPEAGYQPPPELRDAQRRFSTKQ